MIFHLSTSARVRTGNDKRTAATESKRTLRNGSLITAAISRRAARGILV